MPRSANKATKRSGRHRLPAHKRGYDRWWHVNSRAWLKSEIARTGDPWCRICRKAPATQVDHIIPPSRFHEYGSDRFVAAFRDKSNWQPACAMCNAKKGGGGPLENHTGGMTVVCGPPNSGKNTYVERHADADDLVWDLDALAAAMNPRWKRHVDRPDDVAALLLELRTCVVETVRRGGLNRTCWIIISNEDVAKRVASPLGATLVRCPIGGKE